jgi:hypothetical protein
MKVIYILLLCLCERPLRSDSFHKRLNPKSAITKQASGPDLLKSGLLNNRLLKMASAPMITNVP